MFHTKLGQERMLHSRLAFRNCISFQVWSSPDNVLNVLLWMRLIYLKNSETLMPLSISLNSSIHLVSLIWFDPLISTTQQCFHLPFLRNGTNLLSLVRTQRPSLWEPDFETYIQFTIERSVLHSTVPKETATNTGSNVVANKIFTVQENLRTYALWIFCPFAQMIEIAS